jgi:hypothetical protein
MTRKTKKPNSPFKQLRSRLGFNLSTGRRTLRHHRTDNPQGAPELAIAGDLNAERPKDGRSASRFTQLQTPFDPIYPPVHLIQTNMNRCNIPMNIDHGPLNQR